MVKGLHIVVVAGTLLTSSVASAQLLPNGSQGPQHPGSPDLALRETSVPTGPYMAPPFSLQAPGPTPLLDCANKFRCIGTPYPHQHSPLPLDSGNGVVYGAWLRGGVVYLTTATAVQGPGGASWNPRVGKWKPIDQHAGVAYVALVTVTASIVLGVVAVPVTRTW